MWQDSCSPGVLRKESSATLTAWSHVLPRRAFSGSPMWMTRSEPICCRLCLRSSTESRRNCVRWAPVLGLPHGVAMNWRGSKQYNGTTCKHHNRTGSGRCNDHASKELSSLPHRQPNLAAACIMDEREQNRLPRWPASFEQVGLPGGPLGCQSGEGHF